MSINPRVCAGVLVDFEDPESVELMIPQVVTDDCMNLLNVHS